MAFVLPSLAEVTELLVADFQNRFPTANVSRRSGHWHRLAVFAGGVSALMRLLLVIARDLMPDTARGTMLDRHGEIHGVRRKAATPARKGKALRIAGVPGTSFAAGALLTTADQLVFQLVNPGVIPAARFADVDVLAVSTGAATRKSKGTTLTFVSPLAGVESTAVLQLDLDEGGADREEDEPYRVRVLDAIRHPPMGGAANDFRQWAKELPFVGEAFVWPLRGGLGSVHLAALRAGKAGARVLTANENTELRAYVDAKRPTGYRDLAVLQVVPEERDVEIAVSPMDDEPVEFDWNDQEPPFVTSWVASTRIMMLSLRPFDLAIGDHLVFQRTTAPRNSGREFVVEGLVSFDGVVLATDDELATSPPQPGNVVYAGGPLVERVRVPVLEHMRQLGPGRVDTEELGRDDSFGGSYWEGTLRVAKLGTIAQRQRGVLDHLVVAPSSNSAATNVAPSESVGLIVPRQVIVRRRW